MVFWGSDTDQLRTSASQIDGVGDTIEAMLSGLGSETQALDWQGEDAVAFVDSVSRTRRDGGATFVASLRSLTAAMRANAEAQDAVSASVSTAGGSVRNPAAIEERSAKKFESRTQFTTHASIGFLVRGGFEDGFSATYGSDGNVVTYSHESGFSLELDDALQGLDFVSAPRGGVDRPFDFELTMGAYEGTEFIWEQEPGSTENELKGLNSIPTRQTGIVNQVTGYSTEDVYKDIAKGDLAQPDAVRQYSGTQTAASVKLDGGTSIFGAGGEVDVQRGMEYRQDGSRIDSFIATGRSSATTGVHLGLPGDLGVAVGSDAESQMTLETRYGPTGEPAELTYTIVTHAQATAEAGVTVAGGGASSTAGQGVMVERQLSFDLTDPLVKAAVWDSSGLELARQSGMATEELSIFSTGSSGQSADAILYKVGSDSTSMERVYHSTRAAEPVVQFSGGPIGGSVA